MTTFGEHQPPPPPPGDPMYGRTPSVGPHAGPARPAPHAAAPTVIHVVAKPGGFMRALMLVIGLLTFGVIFLTGVGLGVGSMMASSGFNEVIIPREYRKGTSSTVAVIPITGLIDGRQAEFVRASVDKALTMKDVKAVVLRVDSPGGSIAPSDQIWYQVGRLRERNIPVVASYGGVAASGGYYVSCHADRIVAERTCITGSIGVIAQVFTMESLMDKVGVTPVTLVASGSPQKSVANDIFRTWNEADRQKILTMLDAAYETFLERVTAGRGEMMGGAERVREFANGSIYTAEEALEHGLIDTIGYLDDAIAEAEQAAGVRDATVLILREPPSFFSDPFAVHGPRRTGSGSLLDAEAIRTTVNDLASPRMMYLMQ